jgi:hypothetical protein
MSAILLALMPVIIKGFDLFLDKVAKDKELRIKFLELVNLMGDRGLVSTKLRDSYAARRKELEDADTETPA